MERVNRPPALHMPSSPVTKGSLFSLQTVSYTHLYVLVRMEMDDDAWTCVRNTPGVTGFLGGNGKPAPLSRDEYNKMTRRPGKGDSPKRTSVDIQVGTSVRVTDGPLTDFDGKVSEVNTEAGKLKVTLMIFGRETPVELDFNQVAVIA